MKITRSQLRRLIKEELINEGFSDWVPNQNNLAKLTGENIENEDILKLFNSMRGFGTDENGVRQVFEKRQNDLHLLYIEWNDEIKRTFGETEKTTFQQFAHLASVVGSMGISSNIADKGHWNKDLITWLEEEGLEDEANILRIAIEENGITRSLPSDN
jgi:hypothetical protein